MHTLLELCRDKIKPYIDRLYGEETDQSAYVLRQGKGNMVDLTLVGGSLAWNQLIQNGNFASTNNWTNNGTTSSASNNILSVESTTVGDHYAGQSYSVPIGHKILFIGSAKAPQANARVFTVFYGDPSNFSSHDAPNADWNTYSAIKVCSNTSELAIRLANRLANATIQFKNVMLFDLTQMFGSTIADYIYSLEQATAGAGVAWFRQYFPNVYYGYQSGKIESVNPSSRKVVGKNLLKNVATSAGLAIINPDKTVTVNGSQSGTFTVILNTIDVDSLEDGKTYKLVGCPSGGADNTYNITLYDNVSTALRDKGNGVEFTKSSFVGIINVFIRIQANYVCNNLLFKPMITFSDVADSDYAHYEPYHESTYAFDSSKQLRGIPKLVNNKLSYDGDIYRADGSITRKYAALSFDGDEAWRSGTALTNVYRMAFDLSPLARNSINEISNYLPYVNNYVLDEEHFYIYNNVLYVFIKVTSEAAFKAALASKPLTVIYELATPTTETASAYQNPQRAFTDGTEEFIDAGVTASTRDVSIPVGNNTTYYKSELLPPIEDYADGVAKGKVGWDSNAKLGAHNLLKNYAVTGVVNDITFTVNSDKSITANGTNSSSSASAEFAICPKSPITELKNGSIFSGSVGGSINSYGVLMIYFDSNNSYISQQNCFNGELVLNIPSNAAYYMVIIFVAKSVTVNNITFKPMLRLAVDTDSTYQSYTMTNQELTATVATYVEKTATLSTSTETTVTLTSSIFTTSSIIDVYTSTYGINPYSVVTSNGSCTIKFAKQSSASTITVRVYAR